MEKILIHVTPNADTRTAKDPISKEVLRKDTEIHINDVKNSAKIIADELISRINNHDHTKREYFHEFYENFVQEQTKEKPFKENTWWAKHLEERHHLKDRIPTDVTLFDVLEMILDCNAAGIARSGNVYAVELPNDVLQLAFKNTNDYIYNHMHKINEQE